MALSLGTQENSQQHLALLCVGRSLGLNPGSNTKIHLLQGEPPIYCLHSMEKEWGVVVTIHVHCVKGVFSSLQSLTLPYDKLTNLATNKY